MSSAQDAGSGLLRLLPRSASGYDLVSLGEVMLRLDPGETRIRTARTFRVWEGGGEYNVARGLRRCFGLRTAIVTALVDNDVGRLVEDLMLQGGVDTSWVHWVAGDGVGRAARNGLNFTERGFGPRGARGVSDRGHSAASQLHVRDVDWERLLADRGVRWLHTGGIYAALSDDSAEVAAHAIQTARRHGVIVSYDLNYRASLWRALGGQRRAREVTSALIGDVDVLLGNEEDFGACLDIPSPPLDAAAEQPLDTGPFRAVVTEVARRFPAIKVIASSLRAVRTASENDWGAIVFVDGQIHEATVRPRLQILDRVGGGDGVAAGLIYGLMSGLGPQSAIEYGAAHGALAMSTPGDNSMADVAEVRALVEGRAARVQR